MATSTDSDRPACSSCGTVVAGFEPPHCIRREACFPTAAAAVAETAEDGTETVDRRVSPRTVRQVFSTKTTLAWASSW